MFARQLKSCSSTLQTQEMWRHYAQAFHQPPFRITAPPPFPLSLSDKFEQFAGFHAPAREALKPTATQSRARWLAGSGETPFLGRLAGCTPPGTGDSWCRLAIFPPLFNACSLLCLRMPAIDGGCLCWKGMHLCRAPVGNVSWWATVGSGSPVGLLWGEIEATAPKRHTEIEDVIILPFATEERRGGLLAFPLSFLALVLALFLCF